MLVSWRRGRVRERSIRWVVSDDSHAGFPGIIVAVIGMNPKVFPVLKISICFDDDVVPLCCRMLACHCLVKTWEGKIVPIPRTRTSVSYGLMGTKSFAMTLNL